MLRPATTLVVLVLLTAPATLAPAGGASEGPDPEHWLIGFDAFMNAPPVGSLWHGARVVDRNAALNVALLEAANPELFVTRANADPSVRFVERDPEDALTVTGIPNDPRVSEQYALGAVRAFDAWNVTRGSTNVVIAIVDSGVDASHEDLAAVTREGRDFTGTGPADECGHGTHVAGSAAAVAGNGEGVAGVAEATILPVKVLKSTCGGRFSAVADGITWAVDHGADVITLSLGCFGCSSQAVTDAIAYANARDVLVVAAAGNGQCYDCIQFPASLPGAIAVTCSKDGDASCLYSSTGVEAELAAPGDDVLSTMPGNGYGAQSGTSMSVPHVAGVAALVLALDPDRSPAETRALLKETARDVGAPGHDAHFGHGIVDAHAAVRGLATPTPLPEPAPEPEPPEPGNEPPDAAFTLEADALTVTADARASTDPDGEVTAWSWAWGDGTTSHGATASHAYARAGSFTVTLTVTDDAGGTATASSTVTVERAGPVLVEDFTDGRADADWAFTGLWRTGAPCAGGAANALQFNDASSCSYATGARESGAAGVSLNLSGKLEPVLSFTHAFEVESYASPYDVMRVQVSVDRGASWVTLAQWDSRDASRSDWTRGTLDLGEHRGDDVRLRFHFDSRDPWYNGHAGWLIRDVRVE